jgi:hypothetical protein
MSIVVQSPDSAWAKFNWAQKRLSELQELVRTVDKTNSDPAWLDCDTDERTQVYRRRGGSLLPPVVPFLVGEILYGFRSALDYAVYAISAQHPDFPPDYPCEFPIFLHPTSDKSREDFPNSGFDPDGLNKIQFLPREAQEIVERHQPYDNHPHPAQAPIWWLHVLRNIDQHRKLLMAADAVDTELIGYEGTVEEDLDSAIVYHGPRLEEDEKLLTITHPRPSKFKPEFTTRVLLLEEGEFHQVELVGVLTDIRGKVYSALNDLQPFF